MIRKINSILKSKSGQGFPLAIAITLSLIMIFMGISEYFRLMVIAQGVRDALQDATISTVTENYADVYHGTREGYSGGYQPSGGGFAPSVKHGDIYQKLEDVLGMKYTGGKYVKYGAEDVLEFALYGLQVDISNAPFATADNQANRFEVDGYITLEVPLRFMGNILPPMTIRIKTTAGYTAKF